VLAALLDLRVVKGAVDDALGEVDEQVDRFRMPGTPRDVALLLILNMTCLTMTTSMIIIQIVILHVPIHIELLLVSLRIHSYNY
jgi:hypothetical protein